MPLLELCIELHLLALQVDVLSQSADFRALIYSRNSVGALRKRDNLLKILSAHRLKESQVPTVNRKLLSVEMQERLVRI